jgi:class 3 adenylate cyclase
MPEPKEQTAIEAEIKFIQAANTQIKFYNRNVQVDIFNKIGGLLAALDVQVEKKVSSLREKPAKRIDTYFDQGWHLADNDCSLTIRTHPDRQRGARRPDLLIFKHGEHSGLMNGIRFLTRRELRIELKEGERETLLKTGITLAQLSQYFPDADLPDDDDTVFRGKGSAHIRRSVYQIKADDKPYRLSVDRYYFYNDELDKFSETFTEIEIEIRHEGGDFHPKIKQIADILQAMFEVRAEPVSKYSRFREFSTTDNFEEFYFIGFDLVSYSLSPSWTQKQIVQLFHKIIKDQVLATISSRDNQPIKISIGDGAVIAARVDWTSILRLIKRIEETVARNNAKQNARIIEYRTAVHFGPVFRFTDLNDMISVAGNGINIVNRILAETGGGEVIISSAAHRRIVDAVPNDASKFKDIGTRRVKHDVELHLYRLVGG